MTLKEQITNDFMAAYKAKEMPKKNFLGVIKGEIKLAEGRGVESTDDNILAILKKFEKGIKENITRGDEDATNELELLKPYLPELMSEDAIRDAVKTIIEENGTDKNFGFFMGTFNKTHGGKADNKLVANIIKEELSD